MYEKKEKHIMVEMNAALNTSRFYKPFPSWHQGLLYMNHTIL